MFPPALSRHRTSLVPATVVFFKAPLWATMPAPSPPPPPRLTNDAWGWAVGSSRARTCLLHRGRRSLALDILPFCSFALALGGGTCVCARACRTGGGRQHGSWVSKIRCARSGVQYRHSTDIPPPSPNQIRVLTPQHLAFGGHLRWQGLMGRCWQRCNAPAPAPCPPPFQRQFSPLFVVARS